MVRLKEMYKNDVMPKLRESLGMSNNMRVPRVGKIVVNMGISTTRRDSVKELAADLTRITGQRAVVTKSRKSISNFKLREGMAVGARVTLRGDRMYEFLDRLINATLPRIRDFRGVPTGSFDKFGNYTLGLREQSIFPEIDPNSVNTTQGMDITIVTTGQDRDEARQLLTLLGMPFAEK